LYQLYLLKLYADTCSLTSGGIEFDVLSGSLLTEDDNFYQALNAAGVQGQGREGTGGVPEELDKDPFFAYFRPLADILVPIVES